MAPRVTTPTFCRLCPAFCGMLVTVEGDRVVAVVGDTENPVSRGDTCSKGRASGDLHHHPQRLGAADGDEVEITSAHGTTTARAEVSTTIRPGAVSVPHGFDGVGAPNVNALTSDTADCDPRTGMPRYSGFPVRVRALAPR